MALEFMHVVEGISIALLFMGCIIFHYRSTAPTLNIIFMSMFVLLLALLREASCGGDGDNAEPHDCLMGMAQP